MEQDFAHFKRKEFPDTAVDIYDDLLKAYKRRDKVELMRILSAEYYDIFKSSIRDKKPLPGIKLYKKILKASLVQSRTVALKNSTDDADNFAQITIEFVFKDEETGDKLKKYNVFERKFTDKDEKDW
eukprot:CAMPEP_0115042932 /NCGR_PEP_ID=MMETSP0216-20121206/46562_1 /TAXON_ID=223996 /ORGANISM="Protocruzia adherens, Strain Boccale" /LENGTH=126 /DNA_ID=CAMNT_0002425145 /DNA_START=91 /DNA_END=468 /DNA_ORIENTATION=-